MIKQICMRSLMLVFALVFSCWGSVCATYASSYVDIVKPSYESDGTGFNNSFTVNWDRQRLTATFDITKLDEQGTNINFELFAIGDDLTNANNQLHVYLKKSMTGTTLYAVLPHTASDCSSSDTHGRRYSKSVSENTVTVTLSKAEGLLVNGAELKSGTSYFNSHLDLLFAQSSLCFGSTNAAIQYSIGTSTKTEQLAYSTGIIYESVRLESLPSTAAAITTVTGATGTIKSKLWENFTPTSDISANGKPYAFEKSVPIDWNTDKIIAGFTVKQTDSDAGVNRNVLSVGKSIYEWYSANETDKGCHIHFYYKWHASQSTSGWVNHFQYAYFPNDKSGGATVGDTPDMGSASNFVLDLSKKEGIKVNGTAYNMAGTSNLTGDDIATAMNDLFSLTEVKVGSVEGSSRSNATYQYVYVVSTDYNAGETASGDILQEASVNSFASQKNVKVQYDRTFVNDGAWYTLCLPFSLTAEQMTETFGDGYQLRSFSSVNGTTLNFEKQTELKAGEPYLFMPGKDVTATTTFDGVDLVAPTDGKPAAVEHEGFGMQGIYSYTDIEVNGRNIFLTSNNTFKKISDKNHKMKGTRAYFYVPEGTNLAAMKAEIDGVETSLGEALTAGQRDRDDNRVYNLQGQYVGTSLSGLQRGVYVQNGKKIVVNK